MNAFRFVVRFNHTKTSQNTYTYFLVSTIPCILTTTLSPSTFCESHSSANNDPKKQSSSPHDKSSESNPINTIMDSWKNLNWNLPQGVMNPIPSNMNLDALATTLGSHVQTAIDSGVPTHLSYGFLCGYSSGYALKKIGKVAGIIFGLGFITIQGLQYSGYIEIDHTQLKKDVEKVLDLDKNGKVDGMDGKYGLQKVIQVLQYNVPGTGGFVAGFLGGLRSG